MRSDDTFESQQLAIANEEYEELKREARRAGRPTTVTVRSIERKHGMKRSALANYRANRLSRKGLITKKG